MMRLRFLLGRNDPNLRIDWNDVRKIPMKHMFRLAFVLVLIGAITVAYEITEQLIAAQSKN